MLKKVVATLLVLLSSTLFAQSGVPSHTRLLYADDLTSEGTHSIGQVINGGFGKWIAGDFIAGQGWKAKDGLSALKIITKEHLPFEATLEVKVTNFYPPTQLKEYSVCPFSVWSRPECDRPTLEATPAAFFYVKTEVKFLSGNQAKLMLRVHPDYFNDVLYPDTPRQMYETEYLTWDPTKTYTFRFVWTGTTVWMLLDGNVIASRTYVNASYAKESFDYICLGNMVWDGMIGPIYKDLKIYGPATKVPFEDISKTVKIDADRKIGTQGVCVADVNGDGLEDVYTNYYQDNTTKSSTRLYMRQTDGTFTEETAARGLGETGIWGAAAFVDVDADGDKDLLQTSITSSPRLYINNNGIFTDQAASRGVTGAGRASRTVLPVDIENDGDLDIVVIDGTAAHEVYVNRGDGYFTIQEKGLSTPLGSGQGAVAGDFNGDGYVDIFVTRSGAACALYMNQGNGSFREEAATRGVNISLKAGHPSAADMDNDGDLDIFFPTRGTSTDKSPLATVLQNNGSANFTNKSSTADIKIDAYGFYPGDVDNDGYVDLYAPRFDRELGTAPSARIFQNQKSALFYEMTGTGAETIYIDGRGAAVFDYNQDGLLDLLGVVKGKTESNSSLPYGRHALLANRMTSTNHNLKIVVNDRFGQPAGLGSRIWIYPAGQYDQSSALAGYREVQINQGYQSHTTLVQHFGLGALTAVDVKLKLPTGKILSYMNVPADQLFSISPYSANPKAMNKVKGDAQTGVVGSQLADSVTVRVTDLDGRVLSSAAVTFEVTLGGGSINSGSSSLVVNTDANGLARVAWKLGTAIGSANNTLRVSAVNQSGVALENSPLLFTASATAGPASAMVKVSGDSQTNFISTLLPLPLVVKVTDAFGNVLANQKVSYDVISGNGSVGNTGSSHYEIFTDAQGLAQAAWKLGGVVGQQQVYVTATFNASSPAVFSATATEPQRQLLSQSGDRQTGTVNQALAQPFVVKVQDYRGNALANIKVTFSVISGGGKLSTQTSLDVLTNSSGLASATAVLGTAAGDTNNVFHATVSDAQGSPVIFKAGARAGAAAQLIEVSLNNQTGKVHRALTRPFTVKVVDAYANPVAGHQVEFAVTAGSGSMGGLTTYRPYTDATGYASATLTLGTAVGVNTVSVSAAGLQGSPVVFSATALAGTPFLFTEVSGNRQKGVFGLALPYPFVVSVADSFGNAVEGQAVQFAVTKGNGSLNGQGIVSVLTNSIGRASATLTMSATLASNEVTASTQYNGTAVGSAIVFVATTAASDPDSLAYVSGNYQIGRVSTTLSQPFKVMVLDAKGVPVSNATVTFLAIMSGTGFNGKQTVDVKTNSDGIASATAIIGSSYGDNNYVFQARAYYKEVLLRNAPIEFYASGRKSTARKMIYVSGNNLQGTAGQILNDSLKVRVLDDSSLPVAAHPVTFEVIQGNSTINGSATTLTILSNGSGYAAAAVKMATQPGSTRIRVASDDGISPLAGSPILFDLTAVVGEPSASKSQRTVVTPVIADGQQSAKITVLLKDAEGNAVPNKTVQIFTSGIDVQIKQPTGLSDANGMAVGSLTSARSGQVKVWTMVDGRLAPADTSVVQFIAGSPVEAVPFGSGQMALRGTVLPMPLGLYIYDAYGNPVANVDVTFSVLSGEGVLVQAQPIKSDAKGMASVQWRLGPPVTTQTMQAVVKGLAGAPIQYMAIATPPNPGAMILVSGDRQIGIVNKVLPDSFKVVVYDSTGKAAEGVQVYYHFTGQGQAVTPNPVATDRRGIAALLYRPGSSMTGEFKATATTPGLAQSIEFKFIVQNEATIYLNKQEIQANSRPRQVLDLAVQAVDAYNRPLKNQLLNFEIKEGGGALQGTLPATTDETGYARVKWQLGLTAAQKVQINAVNVAAAAVIFSTTAVNSKPKVTVPEQKNVVPGQLITATISALDADGDAITYGVRKLPTGALYDSTGNRKFQWTPTSAQSGVTYEIAFIATDAFMAADTAKWRITVESVNRAPRVISIAPVDTVLEKEYYKTILFGVEAYDPDNNALSYFWKVNGGFAGNQTTLPMEPEPNYFPEDTWVQVEISDGKASTVVRWHIHLVIPAAVRLNSLQAQASGRQAEVIWQTAAEIDNLGFKILRSDREPGPYEVVTETMIPAQADGRYTWVDDNVQAGKTYYYKLRDMDRSGRNNEHGPVSVQIALPEALALAQNYPNPFNPVTTIAFELPVAQTVQMHLYNLNGQLVRTLAEGSFTAGVHQVVWDGHDDQGRQVTTGIYYYVLRTLENVLTKKLLYTK